MTLLGYNRFGEVQREKREKMMKKEISVEEEEERNNKWIQGKMRNTRKRPFTIAKTRGVYDMSSKCRGWCLIFSNHVFKELDKLLGYERDKENFEQVFSELGFKAKVFEKVTAKEIKQNIEKYANLSASDDLHPTNALAVVILSHGSGNFLCGVSYGVNEPTDKISVDEITDIVSNQNCPLLVGKPKIFILQACRGNKHDSGLNALPEKVMNNQNNKPTPTATTLRSGRELYNDENIGILPSVGEEIMIFYATSSNYASYVPLTGSLFGVQLCVELKRHAWNRDLYDIMLSVNNALRKKDIAIGNKQTVKQVLEISFTSPTKKLYFNPGYFKSSGASTSEVNINADVPKNVVLYDQPNGSVSNAENLEPVRKRLKREVAPRISSNKREIKLAKGQTKIEKYFRKQKTPDSHFDLKKFRFVPRKQVD